MGEWISIENSLPEYVAQVLVYRGIRKVCEVMQYQQGSWQIWNGEFFEELNMEEFDITHWMPLPKSPKG